MFVDTLFFAALTPLLPHYAHTLGLGKAGAGLLSAAYPLGALVGAIPSGIVAARVGVKPTVLVGLTIVAVTTAAVRPRERRLAARPRPVLPGARELVLLDGLARLAGRELAERAPRTVDRPGVRRRGRGCAARSRARRDRRRRGHRLDVRRRRDRLARARRLGGRHAGRPPGASRSRCGCSVAAIARPARAALDLVRRPAGAALRDAGVLGPLRLSALGFGAIAIGAVWLLAGVLETGNNLVIGRLADRLGPLVPIRVALVGTAIATAILPWPDEPVRARRADRRRRARVRRLLHARA